MGRGQLFGQPFVYIFAIIVAVFILAFGVRMTLKLKDTGEYVALIDFKNELEDNVKVYYNFDAGSNDFFTVFLPPSLRYVCFYNPDTAITNNEFPELNQIVAYRRDNLYFLPLGAFSDRQSSFKIDKLKAIEENPKCVKNGMKYQLISMADYVEVK